MARNPETIAILALTSFDAYPDGGKVQYLAGQTYTLAQPIAASYIDKGLAQRVDTHPKQETEHEQQPL